MIWSAISLFLSVYVCMYACPRGMLPYISASSRVLYVDNFYRKLGYLTSSSCGYIVTQADAGLTATCADTYNIRLRGEVLQPIKMRFAWYWGGMHTL